MQQIRIEEAIPSRFTSSSSAFVSKHSRHPRLGKALEIPNEIAQVGGRVINLLGNHEVDPRK